jgi:hypothetical protein
MNRDPIKVLPGFQAGTVAHIAHGPVATRLGEMSLDYPVSRHHRDMLWALGSEFVFAKPIRQNGDTKWLSLIRFGEVLESRFGLAAEVPAVYDHHSDLQIRTVDSIPGLLDHLPDDRASVTREICFISSPDPKLVEKCRVLSRPGRLLVPMPPAGETAPTVLLDTISRIIFSRDPYSIRGAVTGRDFFGRQKLINSVLDDVQSFRVPGIFGMRKTGKTSLIQEMIRTTGLTDRASGRQRVFVYQDLEHLTGLDGGDPVSELLSDLAEALRLTLKDNKLRTKELAELPTGSSLTEFRSALDTLLQRIGDAEVVLVLDEIEYLCPPGAEYEGPSPANQKIPQLFGVLRKLVQERPNFGLVISGLASASVEASELFGRTNPLFSFAHPYYLGPFLQSEGADLLRSIGRQVGISWSESAVEAAMSESGGSAMLLRELGSAILRSLPAERTQEVLIDEREVTEVLDDWRRSVSSNLREIVLHLRRFYPDETVLVNSLLTAPDDFNAVADDYPDHVQRLQLLGAIQRSDGRWTSSRLLEMGWDLAERTRPSIDGKTAAAQRQAVLELLQLEESKHIERKETAFFDVRQGKKASHIELAVTKTVAAFLNTEGGALLVGVQDSGEVVGLERDFALQSSGDQDGFELRFNQILCNAVGSSAVGSLVELEFASVRGKVVLAVRVARSSEPVYHGADQIFFVRIGNQTRTLNPKEMMEYLKSRPGSSG